VELLPTNHFATAAIPPPGSRANKIVCSPDKWSGIDEFKYRYQDKK
jgi:hypothetical protein